MKSCKSLIMSVAAVAVIALAGACGGRKDTDLYKDGKPYTRWWWFSSYVDKSDVRDQLVWLKEHGFGGVEIAWIYPMFLDSTTAHPDFLSEEWLEPVAYAKRVADSLGLGCDYTYGTLWPFSDINLPEGDGTRTYFDSVKVATRKRTWDHPKVARILNHLDSKAFWRYADRMNKGLGPAYKGSKSGLFVDSWEVETRYIWTDGFGEKFHEEHGYAIEPYMESRTLMEDSCSDVRYDYRCTLSEYVMREFYGPFAENARRTGTFSRSQCGGAPTDLLTAFTLVDVPETEAILYEPHFSKIAASAATLASKPVVTSETFTCMYGWTGLSYMNGRGQSPHQGREQIADLKLVCDALFANGTNQIIWHGFPFNKVGRSDNWFYTTCQVSSDEENNLSGDALTAFNDYMAEVSRFMRKGSNYTDLAVYMPLEDAWMGGEYPDEVTSKMKWAEGEYELRYIETPEALKGMQPMWVNGHFLSGAEFRGGKLHCGDAVFSALYSEVNYMSYQSLADILRLAEAGLLVCLATLPEEPGVNKHADYQALVDRLLALPNVSRDASVFNGKPLFEGEDLPDFWCRRDGENLYAFFANPLSATVSYPVEYGYAFTDTGSTREVVVNHHGRSDAFTLDFRPMESILLEITPEGLRQIGLGYIPPKLRGL